jgi:hypothetical protein
VAGETTRAGTAEVGDLTVARFRDPAAPTGHEDVWRYEHGSTAVEVGWRRPETPTPDGFVYTGPELHGRDPADAVERPTGLRDARTQLRRTARDLREFPRNVAKGLRDWWTEETVIFHGDGDVAAARPDDVATAAATVRERGLADARVTFVPREEGTRRYVDQQVAEAAIAREGGVARLGASTPDDERGPLCDPATDVDGLALADWSPAYATNLPEAERLDDLLPGVVRDGPPGPNYLGVVAAGETAVLHAGGGVGEANLRNAVENGPFEGCAAVFGANAETVRETLGEAGVRTLGWEEATAEARLTDLVAADRAEAVERARPDGEAEGSTRES